MSLTHTHETGTHETGKVCLAAVFAGPYGSRFVSAMCARRRVSGVMIARVRKKMQRSGLDAKYE